MYNITDQEHMNGPYEDITKEHEKDDDNDDNDNDNVMINAPNVLANTQLAKTVCEWIYICLWLPFLIYLIQLAHQVFPDLLAMDIGQPDLLLLIRQFLARITGPNPNASESD